MFIEIQGHEFGSNLIEPWKYSRPFSKAFIKKLNLGFLYRLPFYARHIHKKKLYKETLIQLKG